MKNLLILLLIAAATPALAQSSNRNQKSEIYIGPVFTDGKNYSFEGGSSARTETGYGLSFGYAYNFNRHWAAGFDLVWSEQDYRATVQPGPGNITNSARQINGLLETGTVRFNGTWHMLESNFTPFATGGLGWTYIDTNIPSGLPENVCWAYPWYGYYCSTYVPTASTTRFSYNAGLGLRLDAGKGVFKFLVNSQWADFGGSYGSTNFVQYRIDFGTKF
jgi:Outer membrane protein beta-barrel domain